MDTKSTNRDKPPFILSLGLLKEEDDDDSENKTDRPVTKQTDKIPASFSSLTSRRQSLHVRHSFTNFSSTEPSTPLSPRRALISSAGGSSSTGGRRGCRGAENVQAAQQRLINSVLTVVVKNGRRRRSADDGLLKGSGREGAARSVLERWQRRASYIVHSDRGRIKEGAKSVKFSFQKQLELI